MMKKQFEIPEIDVVRLEWNDIICTSDNTTCSPDSDGNDSNFYSDTETETGYL